MAKQVVWSLRAQEDRKHILDYWRKRNKSDSYSKKLNDLILASVRLIAEFPKMGRMTDVKNIRIKVVRDYLLIYEEHDNQIDILTIWDNRQYPGKLKRIFT